MVRSSCPLFLRIAEPLIYIASAPAIVLVAGLALAGCVSGSADQLGAGLQTNAKVAPTPLTPEQIKQATIEAEAREAARIASLPTSARVVEPNAAARVSGAVEPPAPQAINNGNFPTFGQRPKAQTAQLSKSQADKLRQELFAAGAKADAATPVQTVESSQTEMQKLQDDAATHGDKKLKKIEGQ